MAASEPRQVEWASAEINDATLTVKLTGTSSKAWSERFEGVLALLDTPHSNWGKVSLTKKAVKVAGVQPGSEAELRHFLESVVLQANSDTVSDSPERDSDTEAQDDHHAEGDRRDGQMTATFRSFASE
jgi:hypothetical protein